MRVCAVLLIPLMAAAPLPPVPAYKMFGHWSVACDNTRSCVARGFDETTQADLSLARDAGPAAARLTLEAADPIDRKALRLDGTPVALAAPAWEPSATGAGDPAALSTGDPGAVAKFVAAARNAHALTLGQGAKGRDAPGTVPLDGFTAALLLVDAVQGRSGTPTALIAPTGAGAVPPAPPVPEAPAWTKPPVLSDAEMRDISARVFRLRSPAFDACTMDDAPDVSALDAAHALAIRPCYMAAYQSSALVEVFPRAGGAPVPVALKLPGLPPDQSQGPDMVEAAFDPATGQLSTSAKGRGLADCGLRASWVWSGGAFRLVSLAYQEACGGAAPGDWPTLFRTRAARR